MSLLVLFLATLLGFIEYADSLEAESCQDQELATLSSIPNVAIAVRSQETSFHDKRFKSLAKEITDGDTAASSRIIKLHALGPGAWTIVPILKALHEKLPKSIDYILFIEDDTRVNVQNLGKVIRNLSSNDEIFFGRGLKDENYAIIHHYHGDFSFQYPDFASGWLLSRTLLKSLVDRAAKFEINFSIDPQHELSKFIYNEGQGVKLSNNEAFCAFSPFDKASSRAHCATVAHESLAVESAKKFNKKLKVHDVVFGIKTCQQYHDSRLRYLQDTWGKEVPQITYYSDFEDFSIPTVTTGVPNTKQGHCGKLEAILYRTRREHPNAPWIVIADDDTHMNVTLLVDLLSYYNPDEPILLGEKYGYAVSQVYGYDYITGVCLGGGMVLSRAGLRALVEDEQCTCGAVDSPDDMWLGMCFRRMRAPQVHNYGFHQAPPMTYSKDLLKHQRHISFHKCFGAGDCPWPSQSN